MSMINDSDQEVKRLIRQRDRSLIKRDGYVRRIRSIGQLAESCLVDTKDLYKLFEAVGSLDKLWSSFEIEDNALLDILIELESTSEYSNDLNVEISVIVNNAKSVASHFRGSAADQTQVSNRVVTQPLAQQGVANESFIENKLDCAKVLQSNAQAIGARLPEIPLPNFHGDIAKWPSFRDRFGAMVDQRPDLLDIDKMYYLLGCLKGNAADALRGIPVSGQTYRLAWATLESRFNKPRLVACSLVENLLNAPASSSESLSELNKFMTAFDESVSVLESLKIPNLGDFILFSLASRCLPVSVRTMFEAQLDHEFPSVAELFAFTKARIAVLERVQGSNAPQTTVRLTDRTINGSKQFRKPVKVSQSSLVSAPPTSSFSPCKYCSGSHTLENCRKFSACSTSDRTAWTRTQRLCFRCLSDKHWANRCRSNTSCNICSRKHHSLLHTDEDKPSIDKDCPAAVSVPCSASSLLGDQDSPSVILGTALVHVRDGSGSMQTVRALIDSASQVSVITASCVKRLSLKCTRWTVPLTGLSGIPVLDVKGRVSCQVCPRYATDPILNFQAWVLSSITNNLPRRTLPPRIKDQYVHLALADPSFDVAAPVDLLLGADLFPSIMDGRQMCVYESLPAAFSSIFGWVLIGSVSQSDVTCCVSSLVSLTVSIENLMNRFWHVEEPVVAPLQFTHDGRCESVYQEQCVRLESGRFAVPLPFRNPICESTFTGSRGVALRRFEALERKLNSDDKLKTLYVDFMAEYLSLGHMSVATSPGRYFIPHHAVYKVDDGKAKIRVVFDASARSPSGMSLNNALFAGPKLQKDIIEVLTRFRLFRHSFTTDICKMYRQVLVLPEYRKYQHIFWRPSAHAELVEYELNTVTYGVNCAPFLALRVLKSIADEDCDSYPHVRDALCQQTYVDDICFGADTVGEALSIQSDLISVLARSGLELRKWASNTPAVLQSVPPEHRGSGSLSFIDNECAETKVLGLQWHMSGDFFNCELRLDSQSVFTKRGILSLTARFFDPLGLYAPTIFLAKHIMQRTWQCSLSWDDPLPPDIHSDWARFVSELPSLSSARVPRYFNTINGSKCFLFGFCDASQAGYAAVVYLCVIDAPRESSVSLVGSKTKLAPIKALTIPRLELNAAVLLANWMSRVRTILSARVDIVSTYAWTDSLVVLSWLTVPHESFKPYVSNRVHQIHAILPECQWRYVATEENPADCASRGVWPSLLPGNLLYWRGAEFIYDSPDKWGSDVERLAPAELPEFKLLVPVVHVSDVQNEWFSRFSSHDHMLRVVAWARRFIDKCRRRPVELTLVPNRAELDKALRVIVFESQRLFFAALRDELDRGAHVSSKPLARLCPFVDDEGIIRVGGRLKHSSLPYDSKHPILLSKASYLSTLICRRWHKVTCHSGPRVMTALINRQFWVISLRSVIHSVISRCTVCVRFDASNPQPLMSDLPAVRIQQCRAFMHVGVDYAGPLQMRELKLRRSRTYKVYIAIFVCLSVKAVHMELVSDLSTEAFLAAFDRFVARRGLPAKIYSDCGTNFVGAAKQLRQLVNSAESQRNIASAFPYCVWHFNPPGAPHFGGLWEAAVRSAKRLLFRIMGVHNFTYEEFTTILCHAEAVLNSRPLSPSSPDSHDQECITPGHFLIGQPLLAVPPRVNEDVRHTVLNRWKLLDQCHQAFWRRWSTEYLQTLQQRTKWSKRQPNVSVNDMVVIKDARLPPLEWRLGRVSETILGPDGVVRVVRVLTAQGLVVRPVVKVIVLPTK